MKGSQKLLIISGLLLAILGMTYGFWYAVVDEHPTLERMGRSLASAFVGVADGSMEQGIAALNDYSATRFEYVREVHAHGHWVALATLLIVLGLFFQQVAFREWVRVLLATVLIAGAAAFPLGVWLETFQSGHWIKWVTVAGSLAVVGGMGLVVWGLLAALRRDASQDNPN